MNAKRGDRSLTVADHPPWDPRQYLRYGAERARPFFDLVASVPHPDPRTVADLGCGPGGLTATLLERWPRARVWGVDRSREMIDHAVRRAVRDRLSFEVADVRQWQAPEHLDVIVSNACFHWVADHPGLLGHLLPQLTDDGVLAFQVPDNSGAPSHLLLAFLLRQPEWARRLAGVARPSVESTAWYVEWLSERGFQVNAWETTYHHILDSPDAVFEWMGGTTLRPILAALDGAEQERFTAAYGELLREAYPRRPFGTLFGFRRVFVVAQRGG